MMLLNIQKAKIKFLSLTVLILLLSGCCPCWKDTSKKELFVIHIHGDWCKTCDKVDPVVHSLQSYFEGKKGVQYLVFDETSPESLAKSKELATTLGLQDVFEYERHTGGAVFVDKKTKKVLAALCGVTDKEKYIEATEKLLKGEDIKSIDKEPARYKLSKPPLEKIKQAKLYVIDIHHDKCSTCAITAPIFEEVAEGYKKSSVVSFFTFDLSTPKTIDQTKKLAKALDIENIYNLHKHTGEVLFVDVKKKEIVNSLVAETNKKKYKEIIERILAP